MGGGVGTDFSAFKYRSPSLRGKMMSQDTSVVNDAIKDVPAGVEAINVASSPRSLFAEQNSNLLAPRSAARLAR